MRKQVEALIEQQRIIPKMRDCAEMFNFHFRRKEYWEATLLKNRIADVALFIELDDDQMQELFGDGGYREDGEIKIEGLFSQTNSLKAGWESCVKQKHDIQKLTYREVMDMWQKKRT